MKVAIIGGRDFNDLIYFKRCIIEFTRENSRITHIISGCADGADTMAWLFANKMGIEITEFPADWEKHGKKAGYLRNEDIIKTCDYVIAFWDEISKGTKSSIDLAEKYNKPIFIYTYRNLMPHLKYYYKLRENYVKLF